MRSLNTARAMGAAALAWLALAAVAAADEWVVDRLRGQVLVKTNGIWQELARGDVVSDDSPIKSLEGTRVTFARGVERIELSGATEIRIFDREGELMTTVMQAYGTVTVEAERRNIQHFSIQTPYLAAIVKGTRFTVVSDETQSNVAVSRGLVQVQDYEHDRATDISPGQTATVGEDIALEVTGSGPLAPTVTLDGVLVAPMAQGQDVSGDATDQQGNGQVASGKADGSNSGNGNSGNSDNGNAGGNGNGNNGNGNSGGNGNGNSGDNGNGNGNSGGNGNGNGNSGNSDNGNAGGNGNGNGGNHGNGNGNNGNGNGKKDERD